MIKVITSNCFLRIVKTANQEQAMNTKCDRECCLLLQMSACYFEFPWAKQFYSIGINARQKETVL